MKPKGMMILNTRESLSAFLIKKINILFQRVRAKGAFRRYKDKVIRLRLGMVCIITVTIVIRK
jgi:hypothetical protein